MEKTKEQTEAELTHPTGDPVAKGNLRSKRGRDRTITTALSHIRREAQKRRR